jgi:hypothetical protein
MPDYSAAPQFDSREQHFCIPGGETKHPETARKSA